MKYIILALLVFMMTFGLAYAQSVFGIKGGMNISRISGDDAIGSSDSHLGMHVGFLMQYNLMQALVIQPELLYTQKGYNYKYSVGDIDYKVSNSFDYIELPLLIKLNAAIGDIKIQPFIGPSISYLVSAKQKEKLSSDSNTTTVTHTNDVSDNINNVAFGFAVGAEFVFMKKYILGGRYNFGLSDIYKKNLTGQGPDVQNGVFMLNLGYLFNK